MRRSAGIVLVFLAGALVMTIQVSASYAACPQPVYIIAHRCNDVGDVSNVVQEQGVNAVEADFYYDNDNHEWVVAHGSSDSFGELGPWFDSLKYAIDNHAALALVIFDIKTPGGPLLSLYDTARSKLGYEINLIFSIGDYPNACLAYYIHQDFKAKLNQDPRAGSAIDYLVSANDETQFLVQHAFDFLGVRDYWFADGSAAGWFEPPSVEVNVKTGMFLRNLSLLACNVDAPFRGVYTWTYESENRIGEYLSKSMDPFQIAGVNGIFMNAKECFQFANPAGAAEAKEAVAFVKNFQWITGTRFADREQNPFKAPAPKIKCPDNTTVECSAPGGVDRDDPQLDAFFGGAKIDTRGCDSVGDAEVDAPDFFHLNQQAVVTFTATDASPCRPSNSCEAGVTVVDTIAPTIMNIAAEPETLWPPNGKMVPVTLKAASADVCDTSPRCRITSVTSNEVREPAKRYGTSRDWKIVGDLELELRAERPGKGNGRIYVITVECADASGNRTQRSVEVRVPHDRRPY